MKKVLIAIIVLALLFIAYSLITKDNGKVKTIAKQPTSEQVKPKVHTGDEPFRIGDGRLNGSWIRFDGVYKQMNDNKAYYMRFYPEGNVTLIAGPEKNGFELKSLLKQDSPPGVNMIHNTMVDMKGDSIFFQTKASKGIIKYRGTRVDGNSKRLTFLKESLINGRKGVFDYIFEEDSAE